MFASSTVADADLQSLALHTTSIKDINTVTVTCKEGGGVLDRPGLRLLHSLQYQDKYCLLCRSQAYCRSLADAVCYMRYIWPVIGHEPCGIASCRLQHAHDRALVAWGGLAASTARASASPQAIQDPSDAHFRIFDRV